MESSTSGEEAVAVADGRISGVQEFADIAKLKLLVANGSITTVAADLPVGAVEVAWTYSEHGAPPRRTEGFQLKLAVHDGRLVVEDDRDKQYRQLKEGSLQLDLVVRHGPKVVLDKANLGNGDLRAEGPFSGSVNVGNGSIALDGELADDTDINIGNGKIDARLLITRGSHSFNAGNGSIDLRFATGSSVELKATTALGSIDGPAGVLDKRDHFIGSSATGQIGDGNATVQISLGTGSLDIEL
ncbi:DUF4097 family beta strand repeat protein [bacterium]|nr:DUF4097 family beta strand repeat protein [bacterium]